MEYHKISLLFVIFQLSHLSFSQTSLADGTYPVVDTAQSICYDSYTGGNISCTDSGYDADYENQPPGYTFNGAVVVDNITGLMWTQSTDIDGDGVTTDADDKLSYSGAIAYCENLDLGGYSDWRLPDIRTLYSLILFSGQDPSGSSTDTSTTFLDTSFTQAYGDQSAGERLIDGQYVSSTKYVSTTMNGDETVFGVNFVDGRIKGYPVSMGSMDKEFYVLCTRANVSYGLNSFIDNRDKTISDNATGLMWQKNDAQSTDFENAITLCENAVTADFDDWRVPNTKELHSIVDYSRSPDTTNSAAIDPIFNSTSIINENGNLDWGYYWSNTTHANTDNNGIAGAYVAFGRGLGYMNNSVMDVHGAGSQRSNAKMIENIAGAGTMLGGDGQYFYYLGPQGDILRIDNMVRCVRNSSETTLSTQSVVTGPLFILLH